MIRQLTIAGLLTLLIFCAAAAHARIYIPVDQPANQLFPIAVSDLDQKGGISRKEIFQIPEIIRNDLSISGYFKVIPAEAYLEGPEGTSAHEIDFKKWTMVGAGILVKGTITKDGSKIIAQLKLFDTNAGTMLLGKQYSADKKNIRSIAHRFSDDVMKTLTGIRGVFGTKITYTAQTRKKGGKDIFVMDMDGANSFAITRNKSINFGPAWSPSGTQIVYTSYVNGRPDLYVYDFKSNASRQITTNGDTNITAAFSPDGANIIFSSSPTGDSDLYVMNIAQRKMRVLSRALGIDIAPRYSHDGSQIVFASERAGKLNVFKMGANGENVQRLIYVGDLNDSPIISPDGTKILFCGRATGSYDIFTMDSDGANIQRLTIHSGNNEHPRWSPDGRFITFSSTRDGDSAIYMMRYDGANPVRISKGNGSLPDWGPWDNE